MCYIFYYLVGDRLACEERPPKVRSGDTDSGDRSKAAFTWLNRLLLTGKLRSLFPVRERLAARISLRTLSDIVVVFANLSHVYMSIATKVIKTVCTSMHKFILPHSNAFQERTKHVYKECDKSQYGQPTFPMMKLTNPFINLIQ